MTAWRTSVHEASHAHMAVYHGVSFDSVTIVPSPSYDGAIRWYGNGTIPQTETQIHRYLAVLVVSGAAEKHFFGDVRGTSSDEAEIAKLIDRLWPIGPETKKAIERERHDALARAHVVLHADAIRHLAKALMVEKTMSEYAVKTLLGGTR